MSEVTLAPGATLAPPSYTGDQDNAMKELGAQQREVLDLQLAEHTRLNELDLPSDLRSALAGGDTSLPAGTLIHGTRFSPEVAESIATYGVMSGELFGQVEDAETHYCADFFRTETSTTVAEYSQFAGEQEPGTGALKVRRMESRYLPTARQTRGETIGVIVDPTIPELAPLLEADAYRAGTDRLFEGIINQLPIAKDSPKAERVAAILGGVPHSAVAGIIVSPALAENPEYLAEIVNAFGSSMPILNTQGELLVQQPA